MIYQQYENLLGLQNTEKEAITQDLTKVTSCIWKVDLIGFRGFQKITSISAKGPDTVTIETFKLFVGGAIIFQSSGKILQVLSGASRYKNGNHIWPINFNSILENGIPRLLLNFHQVQVKIEFSEPIECASIFVEGESVSQNEFYPLVSLERKDYVIQQIESSHLSYNHIPAYWKEIKINGNSPCKGVFIETNIDEIDSIHITMNGMTCFQIEEPFLEIYGKRFSSNLLWIPFHSRCDIFHSTKESFQGFINLNNVLINTAKCKIFFKTPQNRLSVHSITMNIFRTTSGLGSLRFMSQMEYIDEPPAITSEQSVVSQNDSKNKFTSFMKLRPLDEGKTTCPILYEEITSTYAHCSVCNNNFSLEALIQTFEKSDSICPLCRSDWKDYNTYSIHVPA